MLGLHLAMQVLGPDWNSYLDSQLMSGGAVAIRMSWYTFLKKVIRGASILDQSVECIDRFDMTSICGLANPVHKLLEIS